MSSGSNRAAVVRPLGAAARPRSALLRRLAHMPHWRAAAAPAASSHAEAMSAMPWAEEHDEAQHEREAMRVRASHEEGMEGSDASGPIADHLLPADGWIDDASAVADEEGAPHDMVDLTWLGRLRDADDEWHFRARYLRPMLERQAVVVGAACAAFSLFDTLAHFASRDGPDPKGVAFSLHLRAQLAVSGAFGVYALGSAVARAAMLPLGLVEALGCAWLALTIVCWYAIYHPLAFLELAPEGGEPRHAPSQPSQPSAAELAEMHWAMGPLYSNSPAVLRTFAVLAAVGVWVPYYAVHFAALASAVLAGTLAFELTVPVEREPRDVFTNLGVLLVLVIVTTGGSWRVGRSKRARYLLIRAASDEAQKRRLHERARAGQQQWLTRAKAARHARSRLLRMVLHELRSPLLSISSSAAKLHALDGRTQLVDGGVQAQINALTSCVTLMEQTLTGMLDFERIDSGRLVLVPNAFRVPQLLDAALAAFSALARSKGIALVAEPPPHELARTLFIGDVRRLQQCLNSGISNAIKFTEAGGEVRIVAWEAMRPADAPGDVDDGLASVHIAVHDTGLGLDAQALAALNDDDDDAFGRVGHGSLGGGGGSTGTGLGLAIARRILRLHSDSRFVITSAGPQMGAQFEIVLALQPIPTDERPHDDAPDVPGAGVGAGGALGACRTRGNGRRAAPGALASPSVAAGAAGASARASALRRSSQPGSGGASRWRVGSSRGVADAVGAAAGMQLRGPLPVLGSLHTVFANQDGSLQVECLEAFPAARSPSPSAAAHGARRPSADETSARHVASPTVAPSHACSDSRTAGPPDSPLRPGEACAPAARASSVDARSSGKKELLVYPPDFCALHVEDDTFLQKMLPMRTFKQLGTPYEQVTNGLEAVELVLRDLARFQLILLDNQMPMMTGTVASRELRRAGYTGIIIGMTGDPFGSPERAEFEAAGLNACVNKDSKGMGEIVRLLKSFAMPSRAPVAAAAAAAPRALDARQSRASSPSEPTPISAVELAHVPAHVPDACGAAPASSPSTPPVGGAHGEGARSVAEPPPD